ncbi:MAG: transcription elongation factor [Pyrodictiaceae archaeon]
MVQIPLDYVCVKSGVLCPRCQGLVDSGVVDEREIPIMKALIELEENENMQLLKKATYHKAYFVDNEMIVVIMDLGIGTSVPVFTRYARQVEQKLQEKLGIRVKLIPKANDVRSLASFLLYPSRILGVNILWLPDGSIEYVIRVSRRDQKYIMVRKQVYEKILSEMLGKRTMIRFE